MCKNDFWQFIGDERENQSRNSVSFTIILTFKSTNYIHHNQCIIFNPINLCRIERRPCRIDIMIMFPKKTSFFFGLEKGLYTFTEFLFTGFMQVRKLTFAFDKLTLSLITLQRVH